MEVRDEREANFFIAGAQIVCFGLALWIGYYFYTDFRLFSDGIEDSATVTRSYTKMVSHRSAVSFAEITYGQHYEATVRVENVQEGDQLQLIYNLNSPSEFLFGARVDGFLSVLMRNRGGVRLAAQIVVWLGLVFLGTYGALLRWRSD